MLLAALLILTILILALLCWPLLRRHHAAHADRAAFDLNVYRAQLEDLEQDLARGVIEPEEAEKLRVEIERRILRAGAVPIHSHPLTKGGHRLVLAGIVAVLVLVPAVLYRVLGSPFLPDQPMVERAEQIAQLKQEYAQAKDMIGQLSAQVRNDPNDGKSWLALGQLLRAMQDNDQARPALKRAMLLLPGDIRPKLEYAATLVADLPEGSPLPPEFVALMRDVLAINGTVPQALYFVGLAEVQEGHPDRAKPLWKRLIDTLPPGSPDREQLQQQLDALK